MKCRYGFALVELLLAIAILGIFMSLVFVGVQRIREGSNLASCTNNLRQMGIALQQFVQAYKVLPSNGGWDGKQRINKADGSLTLVYTEDYALPAAWIWGVGDPALGARQQTGSWAFSILPNVGEQNLFQNRDWTKAVALYNCLSRRSAVALPATADSHGYYEGGGWAWGHIDYAGNARVIQGRPQFQAECTPLRTITDGTSQTILIGEKPMDSLTYTTGSWFWDEPFFLGGSDSTARNGTVVIQDGNGIALKTRENWGSAHDTGTQFLFVDGSVHLISYSVSQTTLTALLTPSSRDTAGEF